MSRAYSIFGSPAPKRLSSQDATTKNHEGYPAFERSLEEQYLQTLLTNTFGNTFYVSQKDMIANAVALHDKMIAKNPQFVANALAYAREKGYMRTQPTFGLAKLAASDEVDFDSVFNSVIKTPKDLSDFATMVKSLRGGVGGRKIRRAVSKWITSKLSEYWVIKYGAEKKSGQFSLRDLFKLYHPDFGARHVYYKAKDGSVRWKPSRRMQLVEYLLGREANLRSLGQVAAFEALKRAETEDEKIRLIREGKLPHEVATTFAGKSTKVWEAIIEQMPVLALLKNLATLERQGVLTELTSINSKARQAVNFKLTTLDSIANSKILPYRFLDAMAKVSVSWVRDALRSALELSFVNLPEIPGRTAIFVDISVSMSGTLLKAAGIFGVALAKKTQDVRMMLFNNSAHEFPISRHDSILTQAEKIRVDGGTDTASPFEKLLAERDKVDNIILITDDQQNAGRPLVDVVKDYRNKVNSKMKLFVINVSPYEQALCGDEKNTYYIHGWSPEVLNFISFAAQGWGSVADAVRRGVA